MYVVHFMFPLLPVRSQQVAQSPACILTRSSFWSSVVTTITLSSMICFTDMLDELLDVELLFSYINASTLDCEQVMYSQWLVKTATPINPVVESVTKAVKRLQTMFNVFPILLFMFLKNEKIKVWVQSFLSQIVSIVMPGCVQCTISGTKKTDVAIRFVRSDYVEMGALKRLRRRPFVLAALNLFFCEEYNLWQIAGRFWPGLPRPFPF